MKLGTKLIVLFVVISVVPIGTVSYLAYENGRETIERNMHNHLTSTNNLKEAEFERWIENNERDIRDLAQRPLVREHVSVMASLDPADPEHQSAHRGLHEDHLTPTIEEEGGFTDLYLIKAADGMIIVSTDESYEGKYRESEPYFVEGKRRTYVDNVRYSLTHGEVGMHISTPITDEHGNLIAVLAGHTDLSEMTEIMMHRGNPSPTEETYLVNNFNFFVTGSRFEPGYAFKKATHTEGVEACLKQKNEGVGLYDDYQDVPTIGAYKWLPERDLCILTEIDQSEAFAPIVALRNTIVSIGIVLAFLVAVIGMLLARTITEPVRQLVSGTEEIGKGNLEYKIQVESRDEIGQLSYAFNEMVKNLKSVTASRDELNKEIEEREKAEKSLLESEEKYRNLVDNALVGVFRTNLKGEVLYVNEAFVKMLEFESPEEFASSGALARYKNPKDREVLAENLKKTGKVDSFETTLLTKTGEAKNILASVTLEGDTLSGMVVDITDRKLAEDEIRRKSALLKAVNKIFEESLTCETEEDLGRTCLAVAEELTGSKFGYFGEINKKGLFDTIAISNPGMDACKVPKGQATLVIKDMPIAGIDRATMRDGTSRIVNGEEAIINHPDHVGTPEGHPPITAFLGVPMKHKGKTIGMIGLGNKEGGYTSDDQESVEALSVAIMEAFRDKQAEKSLLESEEKYRNLVDNALVGVFRTNLKGEILYVNEAFVKMLEFESPEEFASSGAIARYKNPKDREALAKNLKKTGKVDSFETTLLTKTGEAKNILASVTLEGDTLSGMVVDITDRKLAEEMIEERTVELQRSNIELQRFAYISSHDLQEPLRMISSYLQLIEKRYKGRLDSDADDFINYAVEGANRMQAMIDALLTYSRVERHGKELVPTSSKEALEKALANLEVVIDENKAKISHGKLPKVKADSNQLAQVFQNLISNAIKFKSKKAPKIHISAKKKVGKWVFSVKDNGVGIEPEHQEQIFAVFRRLHGKKLPGAGIGLSICKRIIERHGGRMWLESKPGKGSTFYFSLQGEGGEKK